MDWGSDEIMLLASFQKVYVIHWVRLDRYASVEKAYTDGVKRLEELVARVHDIDSWVTIVLVYL